MKIRPIALKHANRFVIEHHRHHKKVRGCKFSIGLYCNYYCLSEYSQLVGVAICGRPNGRKLDNGTTIEVNRLCVIDGIKNGCSMLYSACGRISREMGYDKAITYILESETGASLKASGWVLEAVNVGGKKWNSSGNMIRSDEVVTLFGIEKKYPNEKKQRWIKILN